MYAHGDFKDVTNNYIIHVCLVQQKRSKANEFSLFKHKQMNPTYAKASCFRPRANREREREREREGARERESERGREGGIGREREGEREKSK